MTKLELFQQLKPEISKVRISRDGDDIVGWELLRDGDVIGYGFSMKVPDSALAVPDTEEFDIYEVTGVVDTDFKVEAIDIALHEDYGGDLWAEDIVETDYRDQYVGLAAAEIHDTTDGGGIDVISGSTISSNSVTNAIRVKLEKFEVTFK
jgi:hypothetical protein